MPASHKKVLDESMSPRQPSASKTGKLPYFSSIFRKPWPIGTEFKVMACAVIGCLLYFEIQKGKDPMRNAKHCDDHGGTAACSLRLAEATEKLGQKSENGPNFFLGDSSSVKLTEKILKRRDMLSLVQ
jgi:hypothetical protein